MMKRKYEVRWYELNLTKEKSIKFFTAIGTALFAAYLETYEDMKPQIKKL